MEKYREKLKLCNVILTIAAVILALFAILALAAEEGLVPFFPVPTAGDSHYQSMWRGFVSGASCALLFFLIFGLARNRRALKDEAYLKKLYVKEHDERTIQICNLAGRISMQSYLLLGLVAVIVAGYFNMVVSVTILGCVFFASLQTMIFKLYYNQKL